MSIHCYTGYMAKKKVTEEALIYNEYGVCIACQGGIVECLHNNLADTNGKIVCTVCGLCVSE